MASAPRVSIDRVLVDGGGRRELVEELPWRQYLDSAVGMNPSTIAYGMKSMLHLKSAWENPPDDSDDMLWGRAAHCLLFEPRDFANRYRPYAGRRQGGAWDDFAAECWEKNIEPMTQKAWDSVQEAALSFVRDARVQEIIAAGKGEVTLFWPEGGIQCRGRVDWISTSADCLVDLKTTKNIEFRAFGKDFYLYKYDLKMGLYQRWLSKLTKRPWPVKIICLEKTKPYDVSVLPIPDAVLERGCKKGLDILERLENCIRANDWPGVACGEEGYLDTPTWEMDDDETTEFREES